MQLVSGLDYTQWSTVDPVTYTHSIKVWSTEKLKASILIDGKQIKTLQKNH